MRDNGRTNFGNMTFAIAISGVLIGMVSLAWQGVTWLYTGARVRVALTLGFPDITQVQVYPVGLHLELTVSNVGRSPAQLTGYGFTTGAFTVTKPCPSPPVPCTLEGEHQVIWRHACAGLPLGDGTSTLVSGYVDLGNGKRLKSKAVSVPNVAIARGPLPGDL